MTITAKYPAICPCCSAPIAPGQQIEWSKGTKARHTTCATASTTAVSTRTTSPRTRPAYTRGRWTGCSCGSREDAHGQLIPSSRNCASCEHDA